MKKLPVHLKIIGIILIVTICYNIVMSIVSPGIALYNNTNLYKLEYQKLEQEQVTNYDGMYLTYQDKNTNANINKEAFVQVTSIIMENRKDGQALAWKWVQENQHIPYQEFTFFYKDLSDFITTRYADNMKIEREKQTVVQKHNSLLATFPNNYYNKILNIKPLVYTTGFISQNTKAKFN